MKFALTSPVYCMEWTLQSDFLFVLAQYMKYDIYKTFVENWRENTKSYTIERDKGLSILVDNGAYENEMVTPEEMLEICDNIKPDIVVSPDKYRVMDETVDVTSAFLDEYKGNAELMVVPQGRDDNEWLSCYYQLLSELSFDWIGIPRWLCDTPLGREGVYFKIKTSLERRDLKVHLLGLPNPVELRHYKGESEVIKSVDTSWPFTFAKQGRMGKMNPEDRVSMVCLEVLSAHQIDVGIRYIYQIIGELK